MTRGAWQALHAREGGPPIGRFAARCGGHVPSLVLHDTQWQRAQDYEAWILPGLATIAGCRGGPERPTSR